MRFGKKAGSIDPNASGATTIGDWPKSLRNGETTVRFLSEIADWDEYWEHYDETVKFFPCTGDKHTCPGCTSPIERVTKASKRYLSPVLEPRTGKVYGLKIPSDLANRLSLRNDRNNGTITSRDYTLIRTGSGLDTEYDVEQEERVAIDISVYEGQVDTQALLASQFAAAWPEFDPDNPSSGNGRKQTATKAAPRRRARAAEDEEAEETAARRAQANTARRAEDLPDDPPSKAAAEKRAAPAPEPEATAAAEDDNETVEVTEDDLRNMPRADLVKLARRAELPVTLAMSREEIVNLFLEQFSG